MTNLKRISQISIKENNKQNLLNTFASNDYQMVSDMIVKTGLTSVTTNSIIKELIEEGWINQSHYGESSGGRKPMVYKFNEKKSYIMQISISKSFIYLIVTDLRKEKIVELSKEIKIGSNQELEKELDLFLLDKDINIYMNDLLAIAVTIPGVIDTEKSTVLYSSPLSVRNFNFNDFFNTRKSLSIPIYVFKRVDGLLMESIGSNTQDEKVAYVLMDDGLGLSVTQTGQTGTIIRSGSELGHVVVDTDKGREILGDLFRDNRILEVYNSLYPHAAKHDAKELKDKLRRKDEVDSKSFIDKIEGQVALICANIINLLAPDRLIIGGGFSEFLSEKSIHQKMDEYILEPFIENLAVDIASISYEKLIEGTINYILYNHVFIATN